MTEWEEKYSVLMNEYIHMEAAFVELQKDYDEVVAAVKNLLNQLPAVLSLDTLAELVSNIEPKAAKLLVKKSNPLRVVE